MQHLVSFWDVAFDGRQHISVRETASVIISNCHHITEAQSTLRTSLAYPNIVGCHLGE